MSLAVVFRRAAQAEFIDAARRYEALRAGLGVQFVAEIERCVTLAAEHPQVYAVIRNNVRRVTAHRFPYSVYFQAEADRIVVLAVFDGRRNPKIWQGRTR